MHTQLLNSPTPGQRIGQRVLRRYRHGRFHLPERIASGDQNPESILNEPETDFRQVRTLPNAIYTDKRDTVWEPLLCGRQRGGQFAPDGEQKIRGCFGSEDASDGGGKSRPHSCACC